MGQEYFLGVQFSKSITDLERGPSEGFQASVSHNRIQDSKAISDALWRSSILRIMDLPGCRQDQFNVGASRFTNTPGFPKLPSIDKIHNGSNSCQNRNIVPDENNGRRSPSGENEMFFHPTTEKNDELEPMGPESKVSPSTNAGCNEVLLAQKRSRKPTKRFIDEFVDTVSTLSRKRRVVSSSTPKDNVLRIKDHQKCHMGSEATTLSEDELTVRAIQVPFGSLAHNECSEEHAYEIHAEARNMTKGKQATSVKRKKKNEHITAVHIKLRDGSAASQKRVDGRVPASQKRKDDDCTISARNHRTDVVLKKRGDCVPVTRQKKRLDCIVDTNVKKDFLLSETEGVGARRKHHVLWSISEVRKLIDGVSRFGVGRWSRIKKLFFFASAHRTPVDLKDKWRNLLRASGIPQEGRQGEKKRGMPWRPLPKSILGRVCELAARYPYPKGGRMIPKMAPHIDDDDNNNDSPGTSTEESDMTLSDYRRMLRSGSSN